MATLAITGTLRTTPTDLIDAHAGVLPMELALLKACHRSIVRLLTLPVTHPLHQIVRQAKRSTTTKHQNPIAQLLKEFKLSNSELETIDSSLKNPQVSLRAMLETASSREE